MDKPCSFFCGQERRGIWKVVKRPEGDDSNNDCEQTFENENPTPASIAADTVHFGDCISEEAAECSSYTGS
jgi:hypothetical protein